MLFLPDPKIIEDVALTEIIDQIKSKFLFKYPDTAFDETSPLYELTCIFAYRELLLRARINDVAQRLISNLQEAYAEKRLASGSLAYYRAKTLEIDGIKDLEITGSGNGEILIYILFDPEKKPKIMKEAADKLNSSDVKLLSDHIIVKEALQKPLTIKAHLILEKGTQIDLKVTKENLEKKLAPHVKIGRGLAIAVLNSLLFDTGVLDILIKEPTASIPPVVGEIPVITEIELSYEHR